MSLEMMLQPNGWSCLPSAAAMVLGVTPKLVIDQIGHDGSEMLYPGFPEPQCRRGFHLQEIVDVMLGLGVIPVYIQALVTFGDEYNPDFDQAKCEERFRRYLSQHSGIILGQHENNGDHAVAWSPHNNEQSLVFDPRGSTYPISEFNIEGALLCF